LSNENATALVKTVEIDPHAADRETEHIAPRLWQIVGAIKLGNRLAESLSSQAVHALEQVRDEKLYLATGLQTFDEFLDNHPDSPMSHDTFRRRVNLLLSEGDVTFDLLNSLNVPLSARKLLAGNISVDGDCVVITEEKGDRISSTRIPLDDRVRIVEAIVGLKKKTDEQARTIERGKKDVDKYKRRADDLQQKIESGGAGVMVDGMPYARALVNALGDLSLLKDEISKIEDEAERKRFGDQALELIAKQKVELEESLGYAAPEEM
jgi:hypothetical protein